jgi:hypothetical protein
MSSIEPDVTTIEPDVTEKRKSKKRKPKPSLASESEELRLRRLEQLLAIDDAVIPFNDFCFLSAISSATGRRIISAGGVTVTWLSSRRMGIRARHYREFLDRRASTAERN